MSKKPLSTAQRRLDADLWAIALITLAVFIVYATMGKQLTAFVKNENISVLSRLLVSAAVQFGIAGLGISVVCIWRRESFAHFGLVRKNALPAILGAVAAALFAASAVGEAGGQIILISAFTVGVNFMSGIYPGATTMGTLELFNVPYDKYLRFMLLRLIPLVLISAAIISVAPYLGLAH